MGSARNNPVYRDVQTAAASGTAELVAAVANKRIRVIFLVAVGAGSSLTFKSATTTKAGPWPVGSGVPLVLPETDEAWFETAEGEALNVTTGSGGDTGILIGYTLESL